MAKAVNGHDFCKAHSVADLEYRITLHLLLIWPKNLQRSIFTPAADRTTLS